MEEKGTTILLREAEVRKRTGIGSRSTLYKLIREGRFKPGVPLFEGARVVGWPQEEVEDFIRTQIAKARARR